MDSSNNTDTGDTGSKGANSTVAHIPPRISMISTAVSFLQNPNVARNSLVQKEKFLRSKGLSDEEIQLAFQQAGIFTKDPNNTIINMEIGHRPPPAVQPLTQATLSPLYRSPDTALQKFYNIISSTAMVTGIVYAIYYVYKKFIEPFLFGRKKDRKSTNDLIEELDTKMDKNIRKLNVEMTALKEEIRSSYNGDHLLRQDMLSFKNDLDAIKGLLLNRKQFASPVVPPSIPAWQLQSQRTMSNVAEASQHTDSDKNDDNGSADGSGGSSETEVVTKHSDSSLELL
ncbi:peroxisomal membrane protein PEX14 isoform X2 [Sitodiplosis mosellana]|nr:peroxisomal membrane protein PEX14 isoform X2 [Sitodiplosis mosellana]